MNNINEYRIIFLYTHIAGYFINCVKTLKELYPKNKVVFVYEGVDKDAPFLLNVASVQAYSIDEVVKNFSSLSNFCKTFDPDVVYVSGWANPQYLNVVKTLKKQGKIIIAGLDNPWVGTLRQRVACLIAPFFQKKYFSHIWVAGVSQYEFARRMGYSKKNILLGLYSADIDNFQKSIPKFLSNKERKTLIYVGRFIPQKGLELLCKVFEELCLEPNFTWRLLLIGDGVQKKDIPMSENIELRDFMQPAELISAITETDAFILPSNYEPWGVVVHEFAAAGLPIITSDAVNAASAFVRHGYNGYIFKTNDRKSLRRTLLLLNELSSETLKYMGERSKTLALQNTPKIWAHTLMGLLN